MSEYDLKARLIGAYEYFDSIGHERNKKRIRQLSRKLTSHEFGVAFAGHFSAGKSRMINSILNQQLLPSSPIPTSANLVRVHSGAEEYARVFFHDDRARKYLAPYDYDLVRSFCKDGEKINEIELSHADIDLPREVVIMDTPGIDSADDAHRLATEAALHLADIIFYVMDYNHVQSELNFTFTRELTQAGKRVYLVVNQIDKHSDRELSFEAFKKGTADSFHSWGVHEAGIFYTTMKDMDNSHNQFRELQELLRQQIEDRANLMEESISASLQKIKDEYIKECKQRQKEELAQAKAVVEKLSKERLEQFRSDYRRLRNEKNELQSDWRAEYNLGVEKILENAYLMPTPTRDLGEQYLAACQPDFSVGFVIFGRAKKIAAERKRRQDIFFNDVTEKAKAQIEWHLRTYMGDFVRSHGIDDADLMAKVQAIKVEPNTELLESAMRSGAQLTKDGSYVMNYCTNIAEGIKTIARAYANSCRDSLAVLLNPRNAQRLETIEQQLGAISEYTEAFDAMDAADAQMTELKKAMSDLYDPQVMAATLYLDKHKLFVLPEIQETIVQGNGIDINAVTKGAQSMGAVEPGMRFNIFAAGAAKGNTTAAGANVDSGENQTVSINGEVAGGTATGVTATADGEIVASVDSIKGSEITDSENSGPSGIADAKMAGKSRLHKMAKCLRNTSNLLERVPGISSLSQELLARAGRLENKGFMVTLFGAFSAGKSSFANALLGEALLPVSPNPTTAAINKIMPVDEKHPHGSVDIKLKDADMLLADVNRALKAFKLEANSLAEGLQLAEKAMEDSRVSRQRQKSFLRAFKTGYAELSRELGQVLSKNLRDFPDFAAKEEKSCFVDWIEVYYDCEFTRRGITLVDTPGADSINARHTNMSFSFIRQSDVVLFVTYYNHAFSRADREFLIQLGRVKDAFQLDKMFFIVNAIDLAESAEEANGVVEYVRRQLMNYGVRRPQMFPISSQQLLKDKQSGKLERSEFEDAFYNFVFNDLTDIALEAAQQEYKRAKDLVAELIKISKGDATQKELRRAKLISDREKVFALLNDLTGSSSGELQELQSRQQQEIDELLYYLKQRVFLRYGDFFKEAFNPATLREGSSLKVELQDCLTQLIDSVGFDLAQEMRATGLRLERFLQKSMLAWQQLIMSRLAEIDGELSFNTLKPIFESGLEFQPAFRKADRSKYAKVMKLFKGPHSFFEQGGKKAMAEAMEPILAAAADEYIRAEKRKIEGALAGAMGELLGKTEKHVYNQLEDFYKSKLAALDGGLTTAELEKIYSQL